MRTKYTTLEKTKLQFETNSSKLKTPYNEGSLYHPALQNRPGPAKWLKKANPKPP